MPFTFRFTAMTNVNAYKRAWESAEVLPLDANQDIEPGEEVMVRDSDGQTGGSANLVRRESGSNSSPVAIKPTQPRWIAASALFTAVVNTDRTEAIYEKAYTKV